MSFLSRAQILLRTPATTTFSRQAPRCFSTSIVQHKSATETVKDGLKAIDRTVSDAAVSGIDKGVEMKDAAASSVGSNVQKPAEGKASELAGEAKGKAAELKGEAKGKAEEIKAKM